MAPTAHRSFISCIQQPGTHASSLDSATSCRCHLYHKISFQFDTNELWRQVQNEPKRSSICTCISGIYIDTFLLSDSLPGRLPISLSVFCFLVVAALFFVPQPIPAATHTSSLDDCLPPPVGSETKTSREQAGSRVDNFIFHLQCCMVWVQLYWMR